MNAAIETALDARLLHAVRNLQTAMDTRGAMSVETIAACAQVTAAAKGTTPEEQRAAGIADYQPETAA